MVEKLTGNRDNGGSFLWYRSRAVRQDVLGTESNGRRTVSCHESERVNHGAAVNPTPTAIIETVSLMK